MSLLERDEAAVDVIRMDDSSEEVGKFNDDFSRVKTYQ